MLKNAVEFSPDNGVIAVEVIKDGAYSKITIRDQGPGIPDYAITRVFDKFYSLCRPNGKKSSGLGLAFVKEVAVMHNGATEIRNQSEGGAEVSFSLPL
jgi:two-component system sensor histidine kinase CreC